MHSFKRTLLKALAFILTVIAISALITEPYFHSETYHYQDDAVRNHFAGSLDTLICGSSHAYRAIIPTELDAQLGTSSYNLSNSLMTMTGRYELLKKELDRNPVEFVILDISLDALTRCRKVEGPEGDLYQLGRYRNPLERAAYFFRYTPLDDYGRIYYDTLFRGIHSLSPLLHGQGRTGSSFKYETRGYWPAETLGLPETSPEQYNTKILKEEQDPQSVRYMKKMISLCRERDIPVMILVTPISEREILMDQNIQTVMDNCRAFCEEQGLEMYDFNLYKKRHSVFIDWFAYCDELHLSDTGARNFTQLLIDTIQDLKAGKDVSDQFYGSYDELKEGLAEARAWEEAQKNKS